MLIKSAKKRRRKLFVDANHGEVKFECSQVHCPWVHHYFVISVIIKVQTHMGCATVCPDPDNTGKLSDEKFASIVWLLLLY